MKLGIVYLGLLMLRSSIVDGLNCGFNDSFAEEQELREMDRTAFEVRSLFKWEFNCDGQTEVPYIFWNDIKEETRQFMRKTMKEFEAKTCIKFDEQPRRPDYSPPETGKKHLLFYIKQRWAEGLENRNITDLHRLGSLGGSVNEASKFPGHVGLQINFPREEKKSILRNEWETIFIHELFHVFGITHTQRRNDRDQYIEVNYENIKSGEKNYQYAKCEECVVPEGVPYECNSIMHYDPYDQSIGWNIDNGTHLTDYPSMSYKGTVPSCSKTLATPEEYSIKHEPQQPTENDWKSLALRTCPPGHVA